MAAVAVVRDCRTCARLVPGAGTESPRPTSSGSASVCAQPTQSGATRLPSLKIESAPANEPVLSGLGLGRQRAANEPVLSGLGLGRESAVTLYGPASTGARGQPLSGFGPARVLLLLRLRQEGSSVEDPHRRGSRSLRGHALRPPPTKKHGRLSLRFLTIRGRLGTSGTECHAGRRRRAAGCAADWTYSYSLFIISLCSLIAVCRSGRSPDSV